MIKITLALLAVGATATHVSQGTQYEDYCWGEWVWHRCDQLYYMNNYCDGLCGEYYAETADAPVNEEHWVSCDDIGPLSCPILGWNGECLSDWIWEDCSSLYWRHDWCTDDCGY